MPSGHYPVSSVFFHFCKIGCGATSALYVVLNWLTFRFVGSVFLAPLTNYLSPSGCRFIVKVKFLKFLALLSNLRRKNLANLQIKLEFFLSISLLYLECFG